ncbi:MAG TPA: YIP1 family protein [Prolixibacteraceae bacterium]|nr:YIP1 family protein [Prolixibacteraceae bacterium]
MNLLQRLITNTQKSIELIVYPKHFWKKFNTLQQEGQSAFNLYFVPGIIVVFIAVVIGEILFNSVYGVLWFDILVKAVRKILVLSFVFVLSYTILYHISRMRGIPIQKIVSRRIVIYSMTPVFYASVITGLFPFLSFLGLFSFYSLYLVCLSMCELYEIEIQRNASFVAMLMSGIFIGYAIIYITLTKLTALIVY